jgi:hypothetical protein
LQAGTIILQSVSIRAEGHDANALAGGVRQAKYLVAGNQKGAGFRRPPIDLRLFSYF